MDPTKLIPPFPPPASDGSPEFIQHLTEVWTHLALRKFWSERMAGSLILSSLCWESNSKDIPGGQAAHFCKDSSAVANGSQRQSKEHEAPLGARNFQSVPRKWLSEVAQVSVKGLTRKRRLFSSSAPSRASWASRIFFSCPLGCAKLWRIAHSCKEYPQWPCSP